MPDEGVNLIRDRQAGSSCGEVVAVPSYEPHAVAVAVGENAKAVVLDFVNLARARWRLLCRPGQTWIETPDCWALGNTQRTRPHERKIGSVQ